MILAVIYAPFRAPSLIECWQTGISGQTVEKSSRALAQLAIKLLARLHFKTVSNPEVHLDTDGGALISRHA